MKPKEALTSAKNKAQEAWRNPETQARIKNTAKRVGDAAIDGAMSDLTGRDGEVKKRKVVRRAIHPIRTGRRAVTNATRAAISEGRAVAKETATDVVRGRLSHQPHEIPVRGQETAQNVPVHVGSEDTPPWDDLRPSATVGAGSETPPWDQPVAGRPPVDELPPPWNDNLPIK